jgi:beta-RFAP synthase
MSEPQIFVEAPARLHFGVLDLRGAAGRWFGGIGAAVASPTLLLSVRRAETLDADGEDAARAIAVAREFLNYAQIESGARICIQRSLPAHAGLGSGTQLSLAVARGLAELFGVSGDTTTLARVVRRGRRSAIGTYAFADGGFVLEGGRRPNSCGVAPLLARLPVPASWRCVIAVPLVERGLSGAAEAAAFDRLPLPSADEPEKVAHLVLMALLPALVDADLPTFGRALTEIQRITGRWFESVQGGIFAPGPGAALVRQMSEWGALGTGQSSWGPAVYGIVDGEKASRDLANRVRDALGSAGTVYEGPFSNRGARVYRE